MFRHPTRPRSHPLRAALAVRLRAPLVPALAVLLACPVGAPAQTNPPQQDSAAADAPADAGSRKQLEIADYRLWRSIEDATISDDGRWVAWTYSRVRGDDTLHVSALDDDRSFAFPRGSNLEISDDGRWLAYLESPPYLDIEKAERDDETVKRTAVLIDLEQPDASRRWADADDFEFSEGSTHLLVRKRQADEDAEHEGADVILRNLRDGFEELLGSVKDAAFDGDGAFLAFTVDAAGMDGNGLYLIDLESHARVGLDNAGAHYARLAWAEDRPALAVLRGDTVAGKTERDNVLLAFRDVTDREPDRSLLAPADGLEEGWVISEKAPITWNEDADRLFVGTKRQRDALEDWDVEEKGLPLADVNIWHWQDDRIQSQQQREKSRDEDRTYVAAAHLGLGSLIPLADERMRTVEVTRDGRWAVGRDGTPYVSDWRPAYGDFYRIDVETGERIQILERQLRTYGLSPDSRNFLYWKEGDFWRYDLEADEHVNLTRFSSVFFTNLEWDYFGEKPPHGVAGWAADGEGLILYDRYDVWLVPLDGSEAVSLTGGVGAETETRIRYVKTDPDAREIDLDESILLETYGQWTKQEGFIRLDDGEMEPLLNEDRRFSRPVKAADAERYLYTAMTFEEFPDLWVAEESFEAPRRITDANPQQDEYLWGHRILFDYENDDGVRLQGTLAIPDDYRPGETLPMIVRFYEKYSQDLHLYPQPMYRHSPNFAGYVSNGYLVMQPDVHFRTRTTHSDMLESVEAATRTVIEMGYADPERIGLSGHSFSGGGGAYIATRSDMFAAVAHGAAPINLVSEFNQLFVGSGQNNHRYDIYSQGRYATNPYDDFQLYWDQSPISGVESMDTPVLYLHGEEDAVVNWEQGLEWYNALRFLGKPIIWLSYPGEGHGLRRLENRIDFQYRLRQFFDHHLKGEPAPDWMRDGVPQTEKERHLREFWREVWEGGGAEER